MGLAQTKIVQKKNPSELSVVVATTLCPIQIIVDKLLLLLRCLLKPIYEDGFGKSKSISVIDKLMPLTNPRKISTIVHRGSDETNGPSRNKKCKYHSALH